MQEEQEYRVPIKILTQRDPIIGGKLSIRELAQWLFFATLLYFVLNVSPLPFQFNAGIAGLILMIAVVFIHVPVNGLAGIEWIFINTRYSLERKSHRTLGHEPSKDIANQKPTFQISMMARPAGELQDEDEGEELPTQAQEQEQEIY